MNTIQIQKRKLIQSGTSIVLTVPKVWLEKYNLKKGGSVLMVMTEDLIFRPATEENMKTVSEQLRRAVK